MYFEGSESGQKQSIKLLQNIVSNANQLENTNMIDCISTPVYKLC